MNQAELEQEILEARDRGDDATLKELQAEYRRSAEVVRITRDPVGLREPSAALTDGQRSGKAIPWPDRSIPSRIVLRSQALVEIENAGWVDHAELGGFLFGVRDGDRLVVDEFSCIAIGERNRVHLGEAGLRAVARRDQILDQGRDLLGWAHSHPESSSIEPLRLSNVDEQGAIGWAVRFEESVVEILVGPREVPRADADWWAGHDRWYPPRLAGWLVHRDGTVRPTDIEIERSADGF